MAGVAALTCLGASSVLAQNGGGNGGGNWRNMSPEERQQARLNMVKDQLEVKDDAEWTAISPLVAKVQDAQRDLFSMGGGFNRFGRGGRGGGDQGGDQGGGQNRQGRGGNFGTPSPEHEALQKAIESKAPKAELKSALDKYVASRKAKQATLDQAQANLRKVLTARQEAIATASGLL
jgi:hypothetical protein